MKRLALIGLLSLVVLPFATAAQAKTLTGTVLWVNHSRHVTGLRDRLRRVHVLRYHGLAPKPRRQASFSLRRGYAILIVARAASPSPRTSATRRQSGGGSTSIATARSTGTLTGSRRTAATATAATSIHLTIFTPGTTTSSTGVTSSTSSSTTSSTTSSSVTTSTPTTSSSSTTTSSTTSTAAVPQHIETWSYDDGCNGGKGASAALVSSWLSFAESSCGTSATKAQSDCQTGTATPACTSLAYLDANKIYSQYSVPIAQDAQESWWLHQPGYSDSAHRLVAGDPTWGNSNLLNQANPSVQSWVSNYARSNFSSYAGLMMDDTGPDLSQQFYGTGFSSSQEIASDSALRSSHEAVAAGLTKSDGSRFLQVDNSLNDNPWLSTPFGLLGHNDGVQGFVAEGQPVSGGSLTKWYGTLLDELSYIDYQPKAFIALLSYDQHGSLTARRLQAATVLLGYSAGHVVSWSDLEQSNSNLSVWPEEGIYPTQPVQTMAAPGGSGCLSGNGNVCGTGGHNDVQVAAGVYRREFRACFNHGVAIGPCATIVNDTSSPVTVQSSWLTQHYSHQVAMVGGDVQSGGSLDLTGTGFTTGATQVAANDALLLAS